MATMNDIARRIGVSRATVSYVLNGRHLDRLGAETQKRVWEAARELGYRRNEMARAIVTGRSRVLGVLAYDNSFENMAYVVAGALDEAVAHGYSAKLIHVPYHGSEEQISEVVARCTSWQLDGVITVTLREEVIACVRREMASSGKPVAYVETRPRGEVNHVRTDDEEAMRVGIEHLAELGHRRIAFLGGPPGDPISISRAKDFGRLMRASRFPVGQKSIAFGSWGEVHLIEEGTRRLLEVRHAPTAIICAGERIGFVAMRTARRMGMPVPEKLSVLGFGAAQATLYSDPPLTTLAQPFREMGVVAVQRLLALIEPQEPPQVLAGAPQVLAGAPQVLAGAPQVLGDAHSSHEPLAVELVVRESTAPPRDSSTSSEAAAV